MLAKHFKFHIVNNTGVTIEFSTDGANNTFTITAEGWNFDSSGGLVFHGSEDTWFADPTSDLTDGSSLEAAAAVDNSTDLFLGAHCTAALITDAATDGTLEIYYEFSTDGGTTYPSDATDFIAAEDLIFLTQISGGTTTEDRTVNFEMK